MSNTISCPIIGAVTEYCNVAGSSRLPSAIGRGAVAASTVIVGASATTTVLTSTVSAARVAPISSEVSSW